MQIRVLVSKWCPVCPQAETVWAEAARLRKADYAALEVAEPAGKTWVSQLRIKTVPAIIIDGALKAVGVTSLNEALRLVDEAAGHS